MKTSIGFRSLTLACLLGTLTVGACNTVKGAGTDIKKTGDAIEDTAEEAKPKAP